MPSSPPARERAPPRRSPGVRRVFRRDPERADGRRRRLPGTCLPAEVSWPSDFLESLPGESEAIGGRIVGLRLEWVDGDFVWRLRSADTRHDMFGEPVDDPSFGKESLVDVRTLEVIATGETELTAAEQQMDGSSAYSAAQLG